MQRFSLIRLANVPRKRRQVNGVVLLGILLLALPASAQEWISNDQFAALLASSRSAQPAKATKPAKTTPPNATPPEQYVAQKQVVDADAIRDRYDARLQAEYQAAELAELAEAELADSDTDVVIVADDPRETGPPALPDLYPARPASYPEEIDEAYGEQHEPYYVAEGQVYVTADSWVDDPVVPGIQGTTWEEPTDLEVEWEESCVKPQYCHNGCWGWEVLPDGLIYRSYMAGPRESRFQLNNFEETNGNQTLWDVALGGRRGIFRYGNGDPIHPQGWQLDIEGAALVRLNVDHEQDVDAVDFRFGVPLTYGWGKWQYKFGYYHLSSHLGDEYIVRTPGAQRKNYVRDAIIFGVSCNPTPSWRLYGETAYAFFAADGAQPWEFQMGAEYAQPGPTGFQGTPFFATNGHLREELGFGGDYTLQLGWLWRGETGSKFRTGFQMLLGHSNNYQWYDESEKQFGWAIWYDN